MMGGDFGSRAMGLMLLPLIVGVFLAGGAFFGFVFFGIPWLWNHVSIVVK